MATSAPGKRALISRSISLASMGIGHGLPRRIAPTYPRHHKPRRSPAATPQLAPPTAPAPGAEGLVAPSFPHRAKPNAVGFPGGQRVSSHAAGAWLPERSGNATV